MNHLKLLGTLALALAACAAPDETIRRADADGSHFAFALIGDMPYGETQLRGVDAMLADINADRSVRFVMHAGDIKGGGERCDDALIEARFRQLQQLDRALIYTPGDNEWTDCHRANNGGYVPTERLAFVRRVFFAQPAQSGGRRAIAVSPQSAVPGFEPFVENVLFVHDKVVFATLHVVGGNNDLAPWSGIDIGDSAAAPRADRKAEFEARQAAALAWVDRAFDEAAARAAAGVFLLMQANPGIEQLPGHAQRTGFEPVLAKLKTRALAFGKPVVLAHGDFHEFLIDMPLYRDAEPAPKVPRFTRIQGFGSPRLHWVKVVVDPRSDAVFRFEPQLVPANRQ
jgi:hypothetical protein